MQTTSETVHADVLTCWKDIASYMGKGVRTVQRWERNHALPVLRPLGTNHKKSAVMARSHDLDEWLREHWSERRSENLPTATPLYADSVPVLNLNMQIRTSHRLRMENHALMNEISTVLHALVQNCNDLMKQPKYAPRLGDPPGGGGRVFVKFTADHPTERAGI
jgi:hypothetical protein